MRRLPCLVAFAVSVVVIAIACGENASKQDNDLIALRGKVPEPCYADNTSDVYSAVGVVAVYDWDAGGYINGGVGVVMNGYVLTARHVVDKNVENSQTAIFLYVPSEERIEPVRIDITYSDPHRDFAILELSDAGKYYDEMRGFFADVGVMSSNREIPDGLLCFFRFVYPPDVERASVVPLPGERSGTQASAFTTIQGEDFMFDSFVGGSGASGSPVFVRSPTENLVLAGIITEVVTFIKVQSIEGKIHQANSAHHFALDIRLICQRLLANANIDLCGSPK